MKKLYLLYFFTSIYILSYAQEQPVTIDTAAKLHLLQEVVVSASRMKEELVAAPVSVSKMTGKEIQRSSSPSFFNAIANMKGVQVIVPGLGFQVINTRGFSNTTNVRFVQLVDNTDNQSPHIGAPIANALCPSDLDIENVEIIQGVASALYGINATNGLANFTTKDPFASPGLIIRQQTAIHHINDPNSVSAKLYTETNIRYAKAFSKKWAFKLNAGFNKGYDWVADNNADLNPTANASTHLLEADNPAYDAVNGYGNESSNRKTLSLGGKNYVVARTGYLERDVTDYHLGNIKGDVTIMYKSDSKTSISYTNRTAFLNNTYQRSNRFALKNYLLQQHIVQYKSRYVEARAYVNTENTGNSYNLRSMAENIDVASKSSNNWYNDYTKAFNEATASNNSIATAHHIARQMADAGRLQPGTKAFEEKLKQLQQINNWDVGAALKVKANLVHAEGMFDAGKMLRTSFTLQAGADFRNYIIIPDGNYFINPKDSANNLNYRSFGVFAHISKKLLQDKLTLSATLRASKYEYFSIKWNPRITAVYALTKSNFLRFSYQNGYRFPSIFEGFSNINSGGVKRVGGLKVMSKGIFENSWIKSSIDAFQAAVNKDVNTLGLSQMAAMDKNKALLQPNSYSYLKPEQMQSFEFGYRSNLFNNKFFIDADLYYNAYSNFIAQIEASVPNTSDKAQIPYYLYDKNKQSRYRLWTNSKSLVYNYGAELDVRYKLSKISFFANGSYQILQKTSRNDGLEDGFNTPEWMANAGINADVWKKLSVGVMFKYQSSFYWQSFLINGNVPSVFNADAMVQYSFNKHSVSVKLGGTNIFNHYYYSILGGPQIGAFYYTTLTWQLK